MYIALHCYWSVLAYALKNYGKYNEMSRDKHLRFLCILHLSWYGGLEP